MYLGTERISGLLEHSGFDLSLVDKVYISCDYRKNKGTGSLYSFILDDLHLKPEEFFHIGDNKISDYSIPQNRGMYSYLYTKARN